MKKNIVIIGIAIIAIVEGLLIYQLSNESFDEEIQQNISLPLYSFSDVALDSAFSDERADTPEKRLAKIKEWEQFEKETGYKWLDFGLVTAKGTWMSDADLANDLNTVNINCWKEFNHCFIVQAEIGDSFTAVPLLYLGDEIYEVTYWGFDEIRATSGTGLGCFEYELVMDRIHQTVTSTRKQVGTDGLCEGTSDKPLLIYLSDSFRESK